MAESEKQLEALRKYRTPYLVFYGLDLAVNQQVIRSRIMRGGDPLTINDIDRWINDLNQDLDHNRVWLTASPLKLGFTTGP